MKKLFILLIAPLTLISCDKDKEDTCALSQASVAGTYRVTAVRYKASASSPEVDYYNVIFTQACEKDDTYTLDANGSFSFNDAGTKCSPPNDYTGNWSLSGNTIVIDGDSGNVDSFNCTTLVVSGSDVISVGDKFTITYTRQ